MKKNKKLVLNKEKIAELSKIETANIKGGYPHTTYDAKTMEAYNPYNGNTVWITDPNDEPTVGSYEVSCNSMVC